METKYIRADLFMNCIAGEDLFTPEEIKTALEMVPAEDVKPVVHAHWIEHRANNGNMHYICSRCGKKVSYPYAKKRWKFCIECGAKMDGGVVYDCNHNLTKRRAANESTSVESLK